VTTQDKVIAAVRSAAAYLGVLLIGWLLSLGIDFPDSVDNQILLLAPVIGVFVYNFVANWLADRWPALGFLLLIPKQPAYDPARPVLVPDTPPAVEGPPPGDTGAVRWDLIGLVCLIVVIVVGILLATDVLSLKAG
jgi:hypothetical protein